MSKFIIIFAALYFLSQIVRSFLENYNGGLLIIGGLFFIVLVIALSTKKENAK